jgi:hypothetical protein
VAVGQAPEAGLRGKQVADSAPQKCVILYFSDALPEGAKAFPLPEQNGADGDALADAVVNRQGVHYISFVTDKACMHHFEHCIAQCFCGDCIGAFNFLYQHKELKVTRRTAACKCAGCCAIERHAHA